MERTNQWACSKSFLEDVATTVSMEEIPADLILNWDQTGIKIVPLRHGLVNTC